LRFKSAEDCLTLDDLELHALDLVVEEGVERHVGRPDVWNAEMMENADER